MSSLLGRATDGFAARATSRQLDSGGAARGNEPTRRRPRASSSSSGIPLGLGSALPWSRSLCSEERASALVLKQVHSAAPLTTALCPASTASAHRCLHPVTRSAKYGHVHPYWISEPARRNITS